MIEMNNHPLTYILADCKYRFSHSPVFLSSLNSMYIVNAKQRCIAAYRRWDTVIVTGTDKYRLRCDICKELLHFTTAWI
jgi:hypothetical protein